MSVFQIEEKIALNSWDDITRRPCYESPVEPKKFRFVRIVAVYSFKDQRAHCGVSDCLQAHSKGFLVVTSDEKETNFCEACGQRFFDMSFEGQKKTLQEQACIREQKIQLNTILEQASVIKERIKELKQVPKGANWLYQVLSSFCKTYPADLIDVLKELATNRDVNAIFAAFAENEADPSQREHVDKLQGLGIFEANIRDELIGKILKPLIELEELATDPDANPSLTRYCQWVDRLEEQFAYSEYLVKEGRFFFDTENLKRLKSIPLPEVSARRFRSVRWNIDNAAARRR